MIYAFLLLGIAIIIVPWVLQHLHVDIRGGEVLVGIATAYTAPQLLHGDWFGAVAEIGLLVLMFEIGLDIDLERLQERLRPSLIYGVMAFFAPFIISYAVSYAYSGDLLTSLLLATGLSSSALAVVVPTMQREGIDEPLVANAAMFSEMIGIVLLIGFARAESLQVNTLLVELFAIIGFIAVTIFAVPKLMEQLQLLERTRFVDMETKAIFYIVFVLALISEQLGIHAATGAFLAGLFLSESTHQGLEIERKLAPVTELLVPIFFFHIGYLVVPSSITFKAILVALALAATVFFARIGAFYYWCRQGTLEFDLTSVSLLAPCMTITATAAQIGLEGNVFSQSVFTTFILAGLFLTIVGPAGRKAWQRWMSTG